MMTRFGSKNFMNKLEPVSTYKHLEIVEKQYYPLEITVDNS